MPFRGGEGHTTRTLSQSGVDTAPDIAAPARPSLGLFGLDPTPTRL